MYQLNFISFQCTPDDSDAKVFVVKNFPHMV